MRLNTPLLICVLLDVAALLVNGELLSVFKDQSKANKQVHKRDDSHQTHFDCKRCYECQCKHYHCPNFFNIFEFSSAAHECKPYGLADCSVKYQQHGGWSSWGAWGSCEGTCDQASRKRTRHCSNPQPKNCGTTCQGQHTQTDHHCKPDSCIRPDSRFTSCSKLCTVSAVTNMVPVLQRNTRKCAGNQTGSSEALPLHCCGDLDKPLTGKGANVMAECDKFPKYTAVASFVGGAVQSGTEGVFVGCLHDNETGFQLIRQGCEMLPNLVHVNTTQVRYSSPFEYYALI